MGGKRARSLQQSQRGCGERRRRSAEVRQDGARVQRLQRFRRQLVQLGIHVWQRFDLRRQLGFQHPHGRVTELTAMTRSSARSVANVILISAGVAAAYVVITRPPLRRLAMNGLRWWLGASVPVYMASELTRAWVQSGSHGGPIRPNALR